MTIAVFQVLDIICPSSEVENFLNALTKILDDGWIRDVELEKKVKEDRLSSSTSNLYCFKCNENGDRRAASLWMSEEVSGLKVHNIVPAVFGSLSFSEYNFILNEFYEKYIKPLSNKFGFKTHLSKSHETIDDWAEPATVKALKLFSACANKSTGRGHPLDDERWMDFVITAHRVNDDLQFEDLRRWLVEEEKWFDEIAWDLSADYEYGRQLLKKYEQS
jgi:hypothetical protein